MSRPDYFRVLSSFVVFMMQQVQTLDGEKSAQLSSKLSFPEPKPVALEGAL